MNSKPRITLRAIEPEDLDLLYQIENDRSLWSVSSTNVPYSRYTLHEYIANSTGDIYVDHQVRLMIENEEHQVVGIVDLVNFDPANRRAELGLIIEAPYRKSGYALATIEAICDYAVRVLHLAQIFAFIDADNLPCITLFRKLEWLESARLRKWLFDGSDYHDAIVMQRLF
jgi:diamine N-acetyltransferase